MILSQIKSFQKICHNTSGELCQSEPDFALELLLIFVRRGIFLIES